MALNIIDRIGLEQILWQSNIIKVYNVVRCQVQYGKYFPSFSYFAMLFCNRFVFECFVPNIRLLLKTRTYYVVHFTVFLYWYTLHQIHRPLNSHGFTACRTVSLPFSGPHGRFFISHGYTIFERIFFPNSQFSKKINKSSTSQC